MMKKEVLAVIAIGMLLIIEGCAQTAGDGGTMKSIAVIETDKGIIRAIVFIFSPFFYKLMSTSTKTNNRKKPQASITKNI